MLSTFGGDEIDDMLEAETSYTTNKVRNPSYSAYPPPASYGSRQSFPSTSNRMNSRGGGRYYDRERDRNDRNRGRYRERDERRERERAQYHGHRGNGRGQFNHSRSHSPHFYNLSKEEEEERRQLREKQDIERDQRTVFACQIHPKCDERDIFLFFSEVGKVIDVQLIHDNRTFKSKGLCYVEFEDKSSVVNALSLSGQNLMGYPISVQLTQAEKNRAAQQSHQSYQQMHKPMKLYVSNIHPKVTEEDIRPVFSAFGEIVTLEIKCDHRGKSKGYGFVEFKKEMDGMSAVQQLNDLEILNQSIKVSAVDASQMDIQTKNNNYNVLYGQSSQMNEKTDGKYSYQQNIISVNNSMSDNLRLDEQSGNGGIQLSSNDKIALMQKLGRGKINASHMRIKLPAVMPVKVEKPMNIPQNDRRSQVKSNGSLFRCLLLKNMFDPLMESDPDFDLDIREDVMEEVGKFGNLLHIYVDKVDERGLVYLKFSNKMEAQRTFKNLNGRWFSKNQIQAEYLKESSYNSLFPDAPN